MDVFVYGTLTDPDRARAVLGADHAYGPDATLSGLARAVGEYPTLVPPPDQGAGGRSGSGGDDDATVEGRILRTDDVAALDAYEGVAAGLYVRVSVPVVGGEGRGGEEGGGGGEGGGAGDSAGRSTGSAGGAGETVETYVGDPDRLGVAATWPGEGELARRVRRYVRERGVCVRVGQSGGPPDNG